MRKIPSHFWFLFPTSDLSLNKKTYLWEPLMYMDLLVLGIQEAIRIIIILYPNIFLLHNYYMYYYIL